MWLIFLGAKSKRAPCDPFARDRKENKSGALYKREQSLSCDNREKGTEVIILRNEDKAIADTRGLTAALEK